MLQDPEKEKLELLTCSILLTIRFVKASSEEPEMRLNKMIGMIVSTGSSINNQLQTSLPAWAKLPQMAQIVLSSLQASSKASSQVQNCFVKSQQSSTDLLMTKQLKTPTMENNRKSNQLFM